MDSFEVENFRSLKHLKLEKLARVNLLVGKNNSGKTSVLEAIFALTQIETPFWFDLISGIRGLYETDQDFSSLFYKLNPENTIEVSARYREGGVGPRKLAFKLDLITEHSRARRTARKALRVGITIGSNKSPIYFALSPSTDVKAEEQELNYQPFSPKADDFLKEGIPENMVPRHLSEFLSTSIELDELSEQISELIINKEVNGLLSIMRQVDPRIESIILDSKGQTHFNLGGDFSKMMRVNLVGEGIQRLLCMVAAIATTAGGMLFIDEIDNGLHYSALRILWKGILQAAREYDVQVFATTHSA